MNGAETYWMKRQSIPVVEFAFPESASTSSTPRTTYGMKPNERKFSKNNAFASSPKSSPRSSRRSKMKSLHQDVNIQARLNKGSTSNLYDDWITDTSSTPGLENTLKLSTILETSKRKPKYVEGEFEFDEVTYDEVRPLSTSSSISGVSAQREDNFAEKPSRSSFATVDAYNEAMGFSVTHKKRSKPSIGSDRDKVIKAKMCDLELL